MNIYSYHRREIKLLMNELDEEKKMRLSLQVRVPNHMPFSLYSPHGHLHRATGVGSQTTCVL